MTFINTGINTSSRGGFPLSDGHKICLSLIEENVDNVQKLVTFGCHVNYSHRHVISKLLDEFKT